MSGSRKIIILAAIIAALVGAAIAALLLASQTRAPDTAQTDTTTQSDTRAEPSPSQTKPTDTKTYPVKVFFSRHPESDDDPSLTFPVSRTSPDAGVATFVVRELLNGPTESESARGYFSYVNLRDTPSNCDNKDFTIAIENGIARLRFCKTFDHIGSVSDGQAESALRASLLQFDTIDKVIILNAQGDCEFDLSGENRCLQ